VFEIDGRAAPGLYVFAWIASGLGLALLLIAIGAASPGLGAAGLTLASTFLLSIGLVLGAGAQAAQRQADGVAGYAGPSPFLVFLASLPLTVFLVLVVVGGLSATTGLAAGSPVGRLLSVALTALVYIGLVRLLVVGTGAMSWADMGLRRLPIGRIVADGLWGAAFALPVIVAAGILAALLVGFLRTTPESPLPPTGTAEGLLLNLVTAAVLAPIGEEVFYRGFALSAWLRTMDVRTAVVRSAAFFAFVHILTLGAGTFEEGVSQAVIAFAVRIPIAVALAWTFLRRGSLYAPIGLHAAYNGILMLIAESSARG
jgi:membrane protease YdiL (CAAX protease family)